MTSRVRVCTFLYYVQDFEFNQNEISTVGCRNCLVIRQQYMMHNLLLESMVRVIFKFNRKNRQIQFYKFYIY